MDLSNLKPAKGSKRSKKRLGRGEGSGTGDTAGRGHKGQKSRSGYSRKLGFEGGQMPLQRRVPKYGFRNINRKSYKAINISTLQELAEGRNLTDIDVEVLRDAGLVGKGDLVKILGNGTIEKKVNVKAHAFSAKAKEAIEAAQGTTEVIS